MSVRLFVRPSVYRSVCLSTGLSNGSSCFSDDVFLGAIQVLRNADGGGGGVSDFLERSVTKV